MESAPVLPDAEKALQFYKDVSLFASRLPDKSLASGLEPFVSAGAGKRELVQMKPADIRRFLSMKIDSVDVKGFRYVLNPVKDAVDSADSSDSTEPESPSMIVVYFRDGIYRLNLHLSRIARLPVPPDPAPQNVDLTLEEALAGIEGPGNLVVQFGFDRDIQVQCRLLEQEAPLTVASFVSMARGLRFVKIAPAPQDAKPVADEDGGTTDDADGPGVEWVRKPWYDGLRPVMAAENGAVAIGAGLNPGFVIGDEFTTERRHNKRGLLTTMPPWPGAGYGVFALTLSPVPALDDVGTVFGECDTPESLVALGRAVRESDVAGMTFLLNSITFKRVE